MRIHLKYAVAGFIPVLFFMLISVHSVQAASLTPHEERQVASMTEQLRTLISLLNSLKSSFYSSAHAATIAFVQVAAGSINYSNANTCSATFPSETNAGNLIIVGANWADQSITGFISDSQGNVYETAVGPYNWSGTQYRAQLFYAKNTKGGQNTVTLTLSKASEVCEMYIHEYAGIDAVSPLDQNAVAKGISSQTPSSGIKTTTEVNEIIFGYVMSAGSISGAGSGFTARSTYNNNLTEDKIVSSIGSYSVVSDKSNSNWMAMMATFKAGSREPSSSPPPPPSSFDFSLANGGARSVAQGSSVTNTVTPTLVSGASQSVSFSASGLPSGATASFSPISCTPTCTSTMTINAGASTLTGNSTITVSGTVGGISRITSFTLTVNAVFPPPAPPPAPPTPPSSLPETSLGTLAASLQAGKWAELPTNGLTPSLLENSPGFSIAVFADSGSWDPTTHQFFFAGSYHNAPNKFIIYRESDNTWRLGGLADELRLHPAQSRL